jgi:hypothetical protein
MSAFDSQNQKAGQQSDDLELDDEQAEREALDSTLQEYSGSMPSQEADAFRMRLQGDQDFYAEMTRTLSQMATLIGGAARQANDAEFNQVRKKILFESRQDSDEAYAMRKHYLENRGSKDLLRLMPTEEMRRRFEERMSQFHRDFLLQHSFRG